MTAPLISSSISESSRQGREAAGGAVSPRPSVFGSITVSPPQRSGDGTVGARPDQEKRNSAFQLAGPDDRESRMSVANSIPPGGPGDVISAS